MCDACGVLGDLPGNGKLSFWESLLTLSDRHQGKLLQSCIKGKKDVEVSGRLVMLIVCTYTQCNSLGQDLTITFM